MGCVLVPRLGITLASRSWSMWPSSWLPVCGSLHSFRTYLVLTSTTGLHKWKGTADTTSACHLSHLIDSQHLKCLPLSTAHAQSKFAKFSSSQTNCCFGLFPELTPPTAAWKNPGRLLWQWQRPKLMVNCMAASTTTTRDKTRTKLRQKLPELNEDDLEEMFVRGSGPGGQATNKTNNCVVLKHIPTGITVKCHQTRSLTENQKIARELLRERLDVHYHGKDSAVLQQKKAHQKKINEKTRRTKVKLEKLRKMKEKLQEERDQE